MSHLHPGACNGKGCRPCWLVATTPKYRTHWNISDEQAAAWVKDNPWVKRQRQRRPSQPAPPVEPLGAGPGTELKKMLDEAGVKACGRCLTRAKYMNQWGVEGCKLRRVQIAFWLREEAVKRGIAKYLVDEQGRIIDPTLDTSIDLFMPFVDEAIARAS